MKRDYQKEFDSRVEFIKKIMADAHCKGIIYGNSGGKDCSLVSILCKAACDNTVGIIMPCSSRNYDLDARDAREVADFYHIETRVVDIAPSRDALVAELEKVAGPITGLALANIGPRLRMNTLYAIAAAEGRLVAGTGNRSERYMGYFTKWGDGACDFNPIADLTVTEIFEFLEFLKCPRCVIDKAPSAALFDGQTDEQEMGVTYEAIDRYLFTGEATEADKKVIEGFHARSEHKRVEIPLYGK